jgi:hypothetical protein
MKDCPEEEACNEVDYLCEDPKSKLGFSALLSKEHSDDCDHQQHPYNQ